MTRFRLTLIACGTVAFAVTVVVLAVVTEPVGSPVGIVLVSLWCTSPVLWWLGWGLAISSLGKAHRTAVLWVGLALAPAFAAFHLLAWVAVHSTSTGGLAYVTVPFVLLVLTIVACTIAWTVATRAEARKHEPDADEEQLAEFERRVDDLGRD